MEKDIGKIALPSMGETSVSSISCSFGRRSFIINNDREYKEYNAFENIGAGLQDSSCLKVVKIIIQNKDDSFLAIEIGRKAYSVLSKGNIDIHLLNQLVGKICCK